MALSTARTCRSVIQGSTHLLAVLREVDDRGSRVRLHARLAEVAHDRHEPGQDARVLVLLQLGAQVGAQLAQRLAGRPAHLCMRVCQALSMKNERKLVTGSWQRLTACMPVLLLL